MLNEVILTCSFLLFVKFPTALFTIQKRLWESLMSGAMVMVDRMAIPEFMPHPFIHKKHLVYYDPNNQTEFNELLDYYVKNQDEARKIGLAGYNFVLDQHMAIDRVSYILDMVRSKIKPVCQSCRKFNRTARSGRLKEQ